MDGPRRLVQGLPPGPVGGKEAGAGPGRRGLAGAGRRARRGPPVLPRPPDGTPLPLSPVGRRCPTTTSLRTRRSSGSGVKALFSLSRDAEALLVAPVRALMQRVLPPGKLGGGPLPHRGRRRDRPGPARRLPRPGRVRAGPDRGGARRVQPPGCHRRRLLAAIRRSAPARIRRRSAGLDPPVRDGDPALPEPSRRGPPAPGAGRRRGGPFGKPPRLPSGRGGRLHRRRGGAGPGRGGLFKGDPGSLREGSGPPWLSPKPGRDLRPLRGGPGSAGALAPDLSRGGSSRARRLPRGLPLPDGVERGPPPGDPGGPVGRPGPLRREPFRGPLQAVPRVGGAGG